MKLTIKYSKETHFFHPMYKLHWYSKWEYFKDRCTYAFDGSKLVCGFPTYSEAFNYAKKEGEKMRANMLNP